LTAWDFALAAWRRPGVETLCLELQSAHGQSPPLLLWRLWLAAEGRALPPDGLSAAMALARLWQDRALDPLRTARRGLKAPAEGISDGARLALRQRVMAAELEAERLLLEALEAIETQPAQTGADPFADLLDLARTWRAPAPEPLLARLVQAL